MRELPLLVNVKGRTPGNAQNLEARSEPRMQLGVIEAALEPPFHHRYFHVRCYFVDFFISVEVINFICQLFNPRVKEVVYVQFETVFSKVISNNNNMLNKCLSVGMSETFNRIEPETRLNYFLMINNYNLLFDSYG